LLGQQVEDPVPLSEEELRLLEQMERALVEEDPKLASTLRGTSLRRSARRRAVLAGVCFLLGIAVMMSGAITETWPLGIAGFVIMLGSATIAVTAIRGQQAAGSESAPDVPVASAASPPPRSWTGWKTAGVAAASRTAASDHLSVPALHIHLTCHF
jgi:hypothetical protein